MHDRVGEIGFAQRVNGHFGIGEAVFSKQDGFDVFHQETLKRVQSLESGALAGLSSMEGRVKRNVVP